MCIGVKQANRSHRFQTQLNLLFKVVAWAAIWKQLSLTALSCNVSSP